MDAQDYLDTIKLTLTTSDLVREVQIVREQCLENAGFFRARLRLQNDDFLEVSEYFIIDSETIRTVQYRYQWMDSGQQNLRKRWDNATHHHEMINFPHHVHVGPGDQVEPGQSISITVLIEMLEREIDALA